MAVKKLSEVSNAAWIIGCKLIKAVLTLVVTAVVSRYLGTENYGLLGYAGSLVAFVAPILKLGIDSVMVYELVDKPDKQGETIGAAMVLNFLSAFVCIAGICAFTLIANWNEPDTIIVCAIYSISLIFQAGEIVQYWYQAKLISKFSAIVMLISYVVISGFQILMVYLNVSVHWFALSYSIDYAIMAILLLIIYKFKGEQKISFSWKRAKELLMQGRYYIVSSLMVTIFAQTDTIMIKLMLGDDATGLYRAAVTCAGMAGFVFAAIIDSMRPSVFKAFKEDEETFKRRMSQLYSIIIYFSLFVSALITLCSPIIVSILYGEDFVGAVDVLRLIVWYTTFSYLGSVRNVWILAKGQQKFLWIINLSGALLNVALNLVLIHFWGIMGAALASLITQCFTNIIIGFIIRPIRANNTLMIKGCNPVCLIGVIKTIIGSLKARRGAKQPEVEQADGEQPDGAEEAEPQIEDNEEQIESTDGQDGEQIKTE